MKVVELPNGRATTNIGFGCATLFGGSRKRASRDVIEAALDAGIRHFDVAPSYAWGQAEAVLGEVLGGMKAQVTITTKVGIDRPKAIAGLGLLRQAAAPLKRIAPALWKPASQQMREGLLRSGQFDVDAVARGLETSLDCLKCDSIDVYLMHEMRPADPSEDLLDYLSDKIAEARLGSIGLGTNISDVLQIREAYPKLVQVAQIDAADFLDVRDKGRQFWITHRALRYGMTAMESAMADSAELTKQILKDAGIDPSDSETICEMFLACALQANADGIVLISTSKPNRVRRLANQRHAESLVEVGAKLQDAVPSVRLLPIA